MNTISIEHARLIIEWLNFTMLVLALPLSIGFMVFIKQAFKDNKSTRKKKTNA